MTLPKRWEVYTPLGKIIPKTKIIAFKVPLKQHFLNKVPEEDRFSPTILIDRLKEQGLKLGLIIDLTFTLKYYDRQDFIKDGVKHKKIFVEGHVVPSEKVFLEFADAIKSCGSEDSVIGVHCTHGVNRTGYLICRYMIEELNIDPEEAISLFNEARGHSIERQNYLEDLRSREPGHRRVSSHFDEPTIQSDTRGHKKKERWRHHREDHPNWRRDQDGESSNWRRNQDGESSNLRRDQDGDSSNWRRNQDGDSSNWRRNQDGDSSKWRRNQDGDSSNWRRNQDGDSSNWRRNQDGDSSNWRRNQDGDSSNWRRNQDGDSSNWRRNQDGDSSNWRRNQDGDFSNNMKPGPYQRREQPGYRQRNGFKGMRSQSSAGNDDRQTYRQFQQKAEGRSNDDSRGFASSRFQGPSNDQSHRSHGRSFERESTTGFDREEHSRYEQAGWSAPNRGQQQSHNRESYYRGERGRYSRGFHQSRGNNHRGKE